MLLSSGMRCIATILLQRQRHLTIQSSKPSMHWFTLWLGQRFLFGGIIVTHIYTYYTIRYWAVETSQIFLRCAHDRISIPVYAIEQQWQSDVKNEWSLMSLIFKNDVRSLAWKFTKWLFFKNYWHTSKWSSVSFSHWQCPSNGDFSFPLFVGLLILSLWRPRFTKMTSMRNMQKQVWQV
jgi:hypothetical protein